MMNFSDLKRIVMNCSKGSFHSILWERPMKTKKSYAGQVIVKRSVGVVRFGINYDNMQSVQSKRQTGVLPSVNDGLVWGEWAIFPYFIRHKGKMYLRCATSKQNETRSEYFLNGVKVDENVIRPMVLASELHRTDELDVFTVNIDNILSVR